jgi:hypothetical protein
MDAPVDAPGACAVYRRRRPERTPLYHAVQAHLETYLELAREGHDDGGGVPEYVEGEFRRYLECGILAHGFARARCGDCGHDFLIAFSCNARRMAETAAHLADNVFPPLPVRQWGISVPKRLRYFLQHDPEAISAVLHILLRVIEARLRPRFGSTLNAHVHFHCCVIDGVFVAGEDGQVQFAEASALTPGAHLRGLAAALRPMREQDAHHCLRHRRARDPFHPHLPGRADRRSRSGPGTWPAAVGAGRPVPLG